MPVHLIVEDVFSACLPPMSRKRETGHIWFHQDLPYLPLPTVLNNYDAELANHKGQADLP